MADKARRKKWKKRRERKRERESEHRSSARQNASLLYERNGWSNSPRGLWWCCTHDSFVRSYLLVASRCLLDILAHKSRIYRSRIADFVLHSWRSSRWLRGDSDGEGIGAIVKRSIITAPFVSRFSSRCTRSYFLFTILQ